jgi:hypothetical protein
VLSRERVVPCDERVELCAFFLAERNRLWVHAPASEPAANPLAKPASLARIAGRYPGDVVAEQPAEQPALDLRIPPVRALAVQQLPGPMRHRLVDPGELPPELILKSLIQAKSIEGWEV